MHGVKPITAENSPAARPAENQAVNHLSLRTNVVCRGFRRTNEITLNIRKI